MSTLKMGILVRELDPPDMMIKRQICLPSTLHNEVLQECHSSLTGGHFGKQKTLANVKKRFLWYGMRRTTEIFCCKCDQCTKFKTDGKTRRGGLNPQVTGVPMESMNSIVSRVSKRIVVFSVTPVDRC